VRCHVSVLFLLALCLVAPARADEAESDPSIIEERVYNLMIEAENLREKKDHEGSMAKFHEALKLDPRCWACHYSLGGAAAAAKNADEAKKHYLAAHRIKSSKEALYNAGVALFVDNRHDEALDMFKMSLDVDPTYTPAQQNVEATLSAIKSAKRKKAKEDL
jgi:Ca-activated chloride channel family protein